MPTTAREMPSSAKEARRMSVDTSTTGRMAGLCRAQERLCTQLGSAMYVELLRHMAVDVEEQGPVWDVLRVLAEAPEGSYPALRLLGSVHRLVLEGRAPALARHYPSVGGVPGPGLWPDFRDTVQEGAEDLRRLVQRTPQTNEVGRSAALLGGFLEVAATTGLPLRLLEVGASAGLNLAWDHYRYEAHGWVWGPADSPVRLAEAFVGATPSAAPVEVAERRGCDLDPVDVSEEDGRLTLLSYVWPDQTHRVARLRAALDVVREVQPPVRVDHAPAVPWLTEQLATPVAGAATVVVHSVVLTYFDPVQRAAFDRLLAQAGERASREAPLAHLSLEGSGERFEVRLRSWPGGSERLLAVTGGHGLPVDWRAGA
jgi:hypothetical protein